MANHQSAKKRARQSLRRRARNRHVATGVKSAVKRVRAAVESGDPAQADAALRAAEGMLRRAASKGVIPAKRASRQISRLAKRKNQLTD